MDRDKLTHSTEVAVMRNPLITAKLDFTSTQMHIFEHIVGQINPQDADFNIIQIKIKDFADSIGASYVKLYNEIEKITKQMIRPVKIKENDGSDYSWISIVTKAKHWKGKGIIEVKFHEDLKPYLLQISEDQYFKIHLRATKKISNVHFKKLYWMLASWRRENKVRHVEFTIDYIKTVVELEGQYEQFADFKIWFLNKAREQFIKNGEFYFDFEGIRMNPKSKRSPFVKVRFTILDNPNWKPQENQEEPYKLIEPDTTTPEMQELISMIMGISKSITKTQATQFVKNHAHIKPEDVMSEILNLFKQRGRGKEIIDPLAWLAIAVKNNYNKGLFEETQEQKKEKEEQDKINSWHSEFEQRFNNFKEQRASEATPEEIEFFKANHKEFLNREGEPLKQFLGEFVVVFRGEVPADKKQNFINWVRKHKGEALQELDGKYKIIPTLF